MVAGGIVSPEVIYYVAASLDGYIGPPDASVAWLTPFEGGSEDYGYAHFFASVDSILLGRKTYEQSLTFGQWPYKGKRCWVFSRQKLKANPGVTVTQDSPAKVIRELKAQEVRRAWLVGGGELAGAFRAEGLIKEYIVSVVPIILGAGVRMFGEDGSPEKLTLVESKRYPSGIVQLRYAKER
jgi:dihydrofolate reductase